MATAVIAAVDIAQELQAYIGKRVRVTCNACGAFPNHFGLGMMVTGKLEKHPDDDSYRVVVNNETYAYFEAADVEVINLLASVPTVVIKQIVQEE